MVVKPITHQVLSRLNIAQIETNGAGKIISNVIELRWERIRKRCKTKSRVDHCQTELKKMELILQLQSF